MDRFEILRAEVKVDIYCGENCDEHRKYFNAYAEGDKQDDSFSEPLEFKLDELPVGAKISVTVPCCPKCDMPEELCECGFDWKNWAEEQYG